MRGDVIYALTKRANWLSSYLSDLEFLERYLRHEGEEKYDYFLVIPDSFLSTSPLFVVYNELQVGYAILYALMKAKGHEPYPSGWLREKTFDDFLSGEKVVFFRKEEEKMLKTVLSFGMEEEYLGFHVQASFITLDRDLSYEEEQELYEEEQEKVRKVAKTVFKCLWKREGTVEETNVGDYVQDVEALAKTIRDDLTLEKLEEETGLRRDEVLKGIGYLVKKGVLEIAYGRLELVIPKEVLKKIEREEESGQEPSPAKF